MFTKEGVWQRLFERYYKLVSYNLYDFPRCQIYLINKLMQFSKEQDHSALFNSFLLTFTLQPLFITVFKSHISLILSSNKRWAAHIRCQMHKSTSIFPLLTGTKRSGGALHELITLYGKTERKKTGRRLINKCAHKNTIFPQNIIYSSLTPSPL